MYNVMGGIALACWAWRFRSRHSRDTDKPQVVDEKESQVVTGWRLRHHIRRARREGHPEATGSEGLFA